MTQDQKKEIIAYLQGTRNQADGAVLYQKYGVNLRLKRQFAVDISSSTKEMLIDELRKLAGLTVAEVARLPRLAKVSDAPVKQPPIDAEPKLDATQENGNKPMPETMKKMIRFRERYTFLNSPDCPDILKVLVADMFTAYGAYKSAHARLIALGDEESVEAATQCAQVVEDYLKNREIWDELEYYRENGTLLGKAAKFREMEEAEDLTKLSDVEVVAKLQSAQVQVSKLRKKVETLKAKGEDATIAEASFQEWTDRKALLKAEVERRKKK